MQIHEIFAPKNEGILKGLATLAGGGLAKYARQATGIGDTPYFAKGKAPNPFISKDDEIKKAMGPLNDRLAQQQFNNWNAALSKYGVDDPTKLDVTTQARLKSSLLKNANKTFNVYNILNFSKNIDPAYKQAAVQAEQNIRNAIESIMSKPGSATQQDWNKFVSNGQEAAVMSRLYSGYSTDAVISDPNSGKWYQGNRELNPKDPNDLKVITSAIAKNQIINQATSPGAKMVSPSSASPSLGGEELDPKDPASQQIIAALKKQGKI